jgi:hypothetical protein
MTAPDLTHELERMTALYTRLEQMRGWCRGDDRKRLAKVLEHLAIAGRSLTAIVRPESSNLPPAA